MKSKLLLLIVLSACPCWLWSQVNVTLKWSGQGGEKLPVVECLVTKGDSTVAFAKLTPANNVVSVPAKTPLQLVVSAKKHESWQTQLVVSSDTTLVVQLNEKAVELDEVVVAGRRGMDVSATGETFTLSKKARAMKDPYRALSEIPALVVDVLNQSVRTRGGESPLILIDGRLLNTGISPLSPADIEKVTVEEVVSARYLDQGITKIVNIQLRKNRPMYTYVEGRTRHDVPLRNGWLAGNFEVGKSKFALYGSVIYGYTVNNHTRYTIEERQNEVEKVRSGDLVSRMNKLSTDFIAKWTPTQRDYFAWGLQTQLSGNYSKFEQTGHVKTAGVSAPLSSFQNNRLPGEAVLGSFFYEHTFADRSILDAYAFYNHGGTTNDNPYNESWDNHQTEVWRHINTRRNQAGFNLDYEGTQKAYGQLELGNHLKHTHDNMWNEVEQPAVLSRVSLTSNYSFASYSNTWKRIMLMASVGLQGLFVKADTRSDSYWRPKASASIGFRMTRRQVTRLSYTLDNELPTNQQLSPITSKTNPWLKEVGNIHLRPMQMQVFNLSHDIALLSQWRVKPFVQHGVQSNMIESYIYKEGDVTVQSFRNYGRHDWWLTGFNTNFVKEKLRTFFEMRAVWERYNTDERKFAWVMRGNVAWWLTNRLALQLSANWVNKTYSPVSVTRHTTPGLLSFSAGWLPNDHIQISFGMNYLGTRSQTTTTQAGNYYSRERVKFVSEGFRPWVLFAYKFRKNTKLKIADKMPRTGIE